MTLERLDRERDNKRDGWMHVENILLDKFSGRVKPVFPYVSVIKFL